MEDNGQITLDGIDEQGAVAPVKVLGRSMPSSVTCGKIVTWYYDGAFSSLAKGQVWYVKYNTPGAEGGDGTYNLVSRVPTNGQGTIGTVESNQERTAVIDAPGENFPVMDDCKQLGMSVDVSFTDYQDPTEGQKWYISYDGETFTLVAQVPANGK